MRLEYTTSTGHHYVLSFNEINFIHWEPHVEIWRKDKTDPAMRDLYDLLFFKNGEIAWYDDTWPPSDVKNYANRVVKLMVFT